MLVSDCIPKLDHNYSVFGLLLHSNLAIPGIVPIDSTSRSPDIELHLGYSPYPGRKLSSDEEALTYTSSHSAATGEPALRVWRVKKDAYLRIAYSDGTQFWVDRKRETLWAVWPENLSLEDTSSYLLGPILGLLLRLRGVTCLHASAIAIRERSVAFVGPEGVGKSTTAGAFAQQGHGILSDDIAAVIEREGAFYIQPAYPHLSLWPESVKMLYGTAEALPRFSPGWEKRRLALGDEGARFENRALPLGAVYLLGERRADPAPYVEPLPPQAALLSLVTDTYANKILDRELRAQEFAVLGRLVTMVPIRRVYPHLEATRLGELCRVIHEDLASLGLPSAARP